MTAGAAAHGDEFQRNLPLSRDDRIAISNEDSDQRSSIDIPLFPSFINCYPVCGVIVKLRL